MVIRPIEGAGEIPTRRPGGDPHVRALLGLHSKLVDDAARYHAGQDTPNLLDHMIQYDDKLKAAISDVDLVSQNPRVWRDIAQCYAQASLPENPSIQNLNDDAVAQFIRGDAFKQIGGWLQQIK